MFIDKLAVNNTVTPEEAIKLWSHRTIGDLQIIKPIENLYYKTETNIDPLSQHMILLGIIWNAGRVQGIREERNKKKHR